MKKMKNFFRIAVVALMALNLLSPVIFAIPQAQAATLGVPSILSYQGRLKSSAGSALTGTYDLVFKLYDASTGGSLLWTETHTDVTVTSGYFAVTLGETTTFTSAVDFTKNLWLLISVEGEDMTSRVAVNSVAFALAARGIENSATEPATNLYGGRMYYNTASGNAYVYDAVGAAWVDVTAASGTTLDDAYNNFGAAAQIITVDDAATGLDFSVTAAGDMVIDLESTGDFIIKDNGTAFATFSDAGAVTLANDLAVNGDDITSDGNLSLSATGYTRIGDTGTPVSANGDDDLYVEGDLEVDGVIYADGGLTYASNVDMSNNLILNIGNAGTDFTAGGGLNLAGDLAVNGDDITSDGTLGITGATGINLTATTGNVTVASVGGLATSILLDSDGAAGTGITLDAYDAINNNSGKIYMAAGSAGLDVDVENGGSISMSTTGGPIVLSAVGAGGNIDISALNGNVDIESKTAAGIINLGDWDVQKTINIGTGSKTDTVNIATDTNTYDVVNIGNNANATVVNIDGGTGGITMDTIDGGAISIDAIGAPSNMSLAATADADDLTIAVTGAYNASLLLQSSGTSNDAIAMSTTAGGIDITVAGAAAGEDLDLTSNTSINLTAAENAADSIVLSSTNGGIDITTNSTEDIDVSANGGLNLSSAEAADGAITISTSNAAGQIQITSTDTTADAIEVDSAGGFDLMTTGAAAGAGDISLYSDNASVTVTADEAIADAIVINASAGGVDITAATNELDMVATTADVNITASATDVDV
ncbi:MAG: hypothetical protein PHT51_03110, partial [Patescibacteria group bacterium]|nr:hypothetical protein [Patescibacteria group bacterium]